MSVAWSADIPVDAMESIEQLRPFVPDESGDRRIGYGLSIAGHIIVMLLLILESSNDFSCWRVFKFPSKS